MSIDLSSLANAKRLLFAIALKPMQGSRFQPTGFPGLGAAAFQTSKGQSLLVESAQSMANRLELTVWDEAKQDLKAELAGLSHVRVERKGAFLTDTILEAHRLNSPYLLEGKDDRFIKLLKADLGTLEVGPIDRRKLADTLLKYDVGSLLHGLFLAKKELSGGRLRIARAMSAFIEADGVRVAASGGVKNDHVNPSGDTKTGFGNVPFARDEYTAEEITLYVSVDLGQIRGYGLSKDAERLLILLALYKLRVLVDGSLRLRTACDFTVATDTVSASTPSGFVLPKIDLLLADLKSVIAACTTMKVEVVSYNDELKKGKETKTGAEDASDGEESNGDTE
jgi:CRISPR-associated protein Csb1